jgi:hypothetical protein
MDEDGLVHWPVLFFYPEAAMQHDVVDDVCEEDTFRCGAARLPLPGTPTFVARSSLWPILPA